MASLQRSAFFNALQKHDPESAAVIHSSSGRTFRYGSLLHDVAKSKAGLLKATNQTESSIRGERIAFLVENSYDSVVTLLAILGSDAVAVPLATSFPATELRYVMNQSEALALISSGKFAHLANEVLSEGLDKNPISVPIDKIEEQEDSTAEKVELVGEADKGRGGMMLYTSGTTARPKGVLLHTDVLVAQCRSLIEAWKYSPEDRLLHVLPLHHIHGTVNALLTPLLAGSAIELMYPFNPDQVWKRLAAPFQTATMAEGEKPASAAPITFFTVVPTIWSRLLQTHSKLSPDLQSATKEAIQRQHLRLNISGSAALPTPTKSAWTDLSSGNILLERYGMTEVGMALSCGLADEDRIDGSVGWPLPSVEVRLVDPDTNAEIPVDAAASSSSSPSSSNDERNPDRTGEIQLRGPTIFRGYFNNPSATEKEFTPDGWFKTGDIACRRPVEGAGAGASGDWARGPAFFIQGRKSSDIIKTGGEKVSALEVEREMLALPQVSECAVVGLPSETWGQKAAAVVVLTEEGKTAGKGGREWGALDMRRALKPRLVAYKIPQDMKVVEELPRNAMGKINKKELVREVFGDEKAIRRRSVEVKEERDRVKAEGGE